MYKRYKNNECIKYREKEDGYIIYIEQTISCKNIKSIRDLTELINDIIKKNEEPKVNINVSYPNNEVKKLKEFQIFKYGDDFILHLIEFWDKNTYEYFSILFKNKEQLKSYIDKVIERNLSFY